MRGAGIAAGLMLASGTAEAAPFTFFCAAPLAHSSQLIQVQPGPTYLVRGRIGPVRLEPIPDPSLPLDIVGNNIPHIRRSAGVTIMNFETDTSVGLVIVPRFSGDGRESVADVYVQTIVEGEDDNRQLTTIRSRGSIWDDLTFAIEVREDRVIVEAGGRGEEIAVTLGRGATAELACIGGSFDFEAIEWDGEPEGLGQAR